VGQEPSGKLPLTPGQRRLRAGIAGATRSSRHDADAGQQARAAFWHRFIREVDPDLILPEAERERRARAALRAHMLRMALRSSRARQARKAAEASRG
jgi:hypothetical protein